MDLSVTTESVRARMISDADGGALVLPDRPPRRRWVLAGLWTFLGLVFASARYIDDLSLGRTVTVPDALAHGLVNWYAFGLFSIPLLALVRRFPLSRSTARSRLPLYLFTSVVFSVLHTVVTHLLWYERAGISYVLGSGFKIDLMRHYPFNGMILAAIVGFHYASRHHELDREREAERARLETLLVRSQLDALRAQLQPHFLFNSLNSVAALIHEDRDAAYEMLTELADLLRLALDGARRQEVPLEEEMGFLRKYAAVQKTRFADRLIFDLQVEEGSRDALVPSLLLQPLVENAILHGVAPFEEGGRVEVSSVLEDGRLRLRVADSGPGLPAGEDLVEGVGLSSCRERLRHLYGERQSMELRDAPEGGLAVQIEIPYRTRTTAEGSRDR